MNREHNSNADFLGIRKVIGFSQRSDQDSRSYIAESFRNNIVCSQSRQKINQGHNDGSDFLGLKNDFGFSQRHGIDNERSYTRMRNNLVCSQSREEINQGHNDSDDFLGIKNDFGFSQRQGIDNEKSYTRMSFRNNFECSQSREEMNRRCKDSEDFLGIWDDIKFSQRSDKEDNGRIYTRVRDIFDRPQSREEITQEHNGIEDFRNRGTISGFNKKTDEYNVRGTGYSHSRNEREEMQRKVTKRTFNVKENSRKEGENSSSLTRDSRASNLPTSTDGREVNNSRNHQKRRKVILPPPGQPGGKDDPLRRGLSGAGCRWYIRYLSEGMTPEAAREKVEKCNKQKIEGGEQTISHEKRETYTFTPPQKIMETKRIKAEGGTEFASDPDCSQVNFAGAVNTLKVAVLPKRYPEEQLSNEELTDLESAIVFEIEKGAECKLKFGGIHFRHGLLVVDCVNQPTADWLQSKASNLIKWKGVELTGCANDEIPYFHVVNIFFPRSHGRSHDRLLKMVDTQNDDLNTSLWMVLSSTKEGSGQLLRIRIDKRSCEAIRKNGHSIFYRFGQIPVRGLGKDKKKAVEENTLPNAPMVDKTTKEAFVPIPPPEEETCTPQLEG